MGYSFRCHLNAFSAAVSRRCMHLSKSDQGFGAQCVRCCLWLRTASWRATQVSVGSSPWVKATDSILRCRQLQAKRGFALLFRALSVSFSLGFLCFGLKLGVSLLRSLPPRRVFLLPQREHDGVSLPLPAVSQLPALSGLLLERPCQRFPQQPAPNEGVHVMGKGRLAPRRGQLCPSGGSSRQGVADSRAAGGEQPPLSGKLHPWELVGERGGGNGLFGAWIWGAREGPCCRAAQRQRARSRAPAAQ